MFGGRMQKSSQLRRTSSWINSSKYVTTLFCCTACFIQSHLDPCTSSGNVLGATVGPGRLTCRANLMKPHVKIAG